MKPLLEAAVKALDSVTSKDLDTIKAYVIPPAPVGLVFEGLCYAFNEDGQVKWIPKEPGSMEKIQDFWNYSKKYVLNNKLISRIKSFDANRIMEIPIKKI